MPLIHVKLVENAFDSDQKRRLLTGITNSVEAIHPGLRDVTFVTIEEVKEGDWAIAGEPITAEKVAKHAQEAS